MSFRVASPCSVDGCPLLAIYKGRCLQHQRPAFERPKASATRRGYGSEWQRTRRGYLAEHPICEQCGLEAATEVHHIIPKAQGGGDDEDNLLAMCERCHRTITGRRGGKGR